LGPSFAWATSEYQRNILSWRTGSQSKALHIKGFPSAAWEPVKVSYPIVIIIHKVPNFQGDSLELGIIPGPRVVSYLRIGLKFLYYADFSRD
jgi:hypothetical protein